jgi:molybdopterin-guanine dinucleotide biosynthesis protein A
VSSQTLAALADALGVSASVARRVCWLVGARPEPITGIVLAGGASSRMGSDKAFLRIGAESAIERALRQLRPLVDHVVVSAAERNSALFGDLHVAVDREPGQGPLMGVACGLAASSTAINFLVACDIPEIDPLLVCRLLSHIDDHDIVVPSLKHGTQEPLFGVYRTCVAQAADLMLHEHRRQATGLSAHCRVLVLPVEHSEWYANLNTREDFAQYVSRNPHDSHREETRNER